VAVFKRGQTIGTASIHEHDGRARIVAARTVSVTLRRGLRVRVRAHAPSELDGPLPAGRRVGSAEAIVAGKVVATVPLVTAAAVPGPSFVRKLEGVLKGVLISLTVLFALLVCTLVTLRARVVRRQRARSAR
jgi:D-alanyl-D-alanine carboxypeptidase (penicillin-binding protein 5/6)